MARKKRTLEEWLVESKNEKLRWLKQYCINHYAAADDDKINACWHDDSARIQAAWRSYANQQRQKNKKKVAVSVYLPQEIVKKIKRKTVEEGIKMSDFFEYILEYRFSIPNEESFSNIKIKNVLINDLRLEIKKLVREINQLEHQNSLMMKKIKSIHVGLCDLKKSEKYSDENFSFKDMVDDIIVAIEKLKKKADEEKIDVSSREEDYGNNVSKLVSGENFDQKEKSDIVDRKNNVAIQENNLGCGTLSEGSDLDVIPMPIVRNARKPRLIEMKEKK